MTPSLCPTDAPARCARTVAYGRSVRLGASLRMLALLLALGVAAGLRAQTTDNWTSTGSSLWGTAGNWSAGVPTGSSIATFNASLGLDTSLKLLSASTANSLVFAGTGGTSAYILDTAGNQNADTLTLAAGITNSDAGALTFYNATTLAGNQSFTNNGGVMTFYGNLNLGSGSTGNTLTLGGSGTVNINGVVANGGTAAGNLAYSGSGTLNLIGANTYTGTTSINSGTVTIQNAGALGTASNTSSTTVASGAVLQVEGNVTTTNAGTLVLNGNGVGQGALQNISANNTWNSAVSLGSNATIYNGTAGNVFYVGASNGSSLFSLGSNTLTVDGAGDTFINSSLGVSGDTGGLVKNGTGQLTLWGYNSFFTGATVVNQGSLELVVGPMTSGWYGINGSLTVGTGSLTNTATVDIWWNGHATGASYANQLSPNTAVTMNAGGTFNDGISTTAGSFIMNGGVVNIWSGQTITLTNGVTSNTNSAHQTSQILGGTLAMTAANTTFNVAQDATLASDLTVSSVISGSALTKSGSGTLTLSGANTYTGGTTLNAGTILANTNSALGTGAVTINAGTLGSAVSTTTVANALTLQGNATFSGLKTSGILTQTGGSYTLTLANATQSGAVKLSSTNTGQTLTAEVDSGSSTISGAISNGGTGAGGLTKTGSGTLVISGANTYTGTTTVNAGTLQLGANNSIGTGSALSLNNSTLNLAGYSDKVGALSFNNAAITFGTGLPTNTLVFTTISSGTGILTINGWTSGSTFMGATTAAIASTLLNQVYFAGYGSGSVEAGSLSAAGNGEGNAYAITPNIAYTTWNGGGADSNWSTGANWVGGTAPATTSGSVQKIDLTGSTQLAPVMNNSYYANALKFDASAGAFSLGLGNNTFTLDGAVPSIIDQSANAEVIAASGTGSIAFTANGVIDVSGAGGLTISAPITGSGSITKLSSGTLALSGNNSGYSGAITVGAGTLQVSGSNNVLGTGSTTVNSGATLQVNDSLTLANNLTLTGTGMGGNGALYGTPGTGNTATVSGTVSLAGNSTIGAGSGTLALTGSVTGSGTTLTVAGAGNTTISGPIATGSGSLILSGTGTTTLSGANTYTGMTTVNSGILSLAGTSINGGLTVSGGTVNDNASNQFSPTSGITLTSGAFNLGTQSETIASLAGTGGSLSVGTGTLTVNGTGSTTYAGTLSGAGTLANTNTGSLTLTGANTGFTGNVNLSNGVIVGAATNATGTATVNVSGTGNFEVQGGSTLASNFNTSTNGAVSNDGAIENVSGANTITGSVTTTANSRIQSDAGTLTISGAVGVGSGNTLNFGGAGNTTVSAAITGGSTAAITKDGTGTLSLGATSSGFTGSATVTVGTLQATAASALGNASSITVNSGGTLLSGAAGALSTSAAVNVNAGGTLSLNGTAASLTGIFNNAGALAFGTGGSLTLLGSTGTLAGTISGSGTLTVGAGETLTLGANFSDASLNIVLAGGTLMLNGTTDTFGTLSVTSTSVIDFAYPAATQFAVSSVSLSAGALLDVNNWAYGTDYFYSAASPGTKGSPPINQIVFQGFGGNNTAWDTATSGPGSGHQIEPTPEPATYGVLFLGLSLAALVFVHRRRDHGRRTDRLVDFL